MEGTRSGAGVKHQCARSPQGGPSPSAVQHYLQQYRPSGKSQAQRGIQLTYDVGTASWTQQACMVTLDTRPIAEGGMRWCMKMDFTDQHGRTESYVGKVFKPNENAYMQAMLTDKEIRQYFDEAVTQTVAGSIAEAFNHLAADRGLCVAVKMLPVSVVSLPQCQGRVLNVEPMLKGKYVKHNDNDGATLTDEQIPHAFSHFSYQMSKGRVLVCDIQGVGCYFTDPQIHSVDGDAFGSGNCGQDGIVAFFESHKCNSLCRRLGLSPFKGNSEYASGLPYKGNSEDVLHYSTDDARLNWDSSRFKHALDTGVLVASRHGLRRQVEANMDDDEAEYSKELEAQRHLLLAKKRNLEARLRRQANQSPRESGRLVSPTRGGGAGSIPHRGRFPSEIARSSSDPGSQTQRGGTASSPHRDTSPRTCTGPTDQPGEEVLRLKLAIKDKIERLKQQQANQSKRRESPTRRGGAGSVLHRGSSPAGVSPTRRDGRSHHGGNIPVGVRTPKGPCVIERCSSAPSVNSNSYFVGTSRFSQTSGADMSQERERTIAMIQARIRSLEMKMPTPVKPPR